jgi:hypothetical protein
MLSASFVPVSYLWYGTLSDLDCGKIVSGTSHVLDLQDNTCTKKTDTHWAVFYGVNAMIYGVPMLTVILHLRKRS